MDIKNIEETACPECGCRHIVEERVNSQHCNGYYNEYRKFDCGMALHFSPNFMRTDPREPCTESDTFKREKKFRLEAVDMLKKYIEDLPVDEKFRKMILDKFDYINYNM